MIYVGNAEFLRMSYVTLTKAFHAMKRFADGALVLSLTIGTCLSQSPTASRKINELIAAGSAQRQKHDYAAAWRTLE